MRAVVQRVSEASIVIDGADGGSIQKGMVLLLGVESGDGTEDIDWLLKKCLNLRIFEDSEGKMNDSLLSIEGSVLIVSQFTLFGNLKKGNRPSFNRSAHPDQAIPLYEQFVSDTRKRIGANKVITGKFASHMDVSLTNDGPVTILLDSRNKEL